MTSLPPSIILVVAVLAAFLAFTVGLKYAVSDNFMRTRLGMTAFFFFIVSALTISFWEHVFETLPYTIPSGFVGMIVGYTLGVTTERQKLMMQGLKEYMRHFAHIHPMDFKNLSWWSFLNFYTVMASLVLINLIGLSDVIFAGTLWWEIFASVFGAFLIGTIIPYLAHLWVIRIAPATPS